MTDENIQGNTYEYSSIDELLWIINRSPFIMPTTEIRQSSSSSLPIKVLSAHTSV